MTSLAGLVPPRGGTPWPGIVRLGIARLGRSRRGGFRFAVPLVAALVLVAVVLALAPRRGATVTTPFLSYTAPAGWTAEPAPAATPPAATALTGTVRGPAYDCDGERSLRGYAAAALLPADAAPGSGPADRAERLARWFAATSYGTPGTPPALTVAPPRAVRVPGPDGPVDATVVEVTATAGPHAGCAATRGTVLALAAPVSGGAALLLVAGDTDGGPAQPAPPDRATLDAVLASVRLTTR